MCWLFGHKWRRLPGIEFHNELSQLHYCTKCKVVHFTWG